MHIKIQPEILAVWKPHPTYSKAKTNQDVGLDIPLSRDHIVPPNARSFSINLGYKGESDHGYMLVPRSSISKTPLILANSIGIIDKSYRGTVIAKVHNLSDHDVKLNYGECYFQIVSFDGNLPNWDVTFTLSKTKRGEGGFGSTTTTSTTSTIL